MSWTIEINNKQVVKQIKALPIKIKEKLFTLFLEIEKQGPVRGNWANYSKLTATKHHCHIKKGKPSFVVVWEVKNKIIKIVEVIYVGTHEKAPY